MRVHVFSTVSSRRRSFGPAQVSNLFTSFFYPGQIDYQLSDTDHSILAAPNVEQLYYAMQSFINDNDYLGFEDAAAPLFIDFVPSPRLSLEFPTLFELRKTVANQWHRPFHTVTSRDLIDYEIMRSRCDEADLGEFHRWLARVDVVMPFPTYGLADNFRMAHLKPGWEVFTFIARQCGVFKHISETFFGVEFWSFSSAFILRSDLLQPFADGFFEAALMFHRLRPEIDCYDLSFIFQRLLSVYLNYLLYKNDLLKVANIPVLHCLPSEPPSVLPVDFNADTYLRLNRDVFNAGMPGASHYLSAGWHEDRIWSLT